MVHKYLYDANEAETIDVSNEQIAAGIPVLLQVRRGSESALNQLLPDAGVSDGNTSSSSRCSSGYTKRWSAAAPLSQEPKERYYLKKDDIMSANMHCRPQQNWSYLEEDENEERDVFIPRRIASGFTRDGSNRLSMQFYGDQPGSVKWADAADRVMSNRVFSLSLPREHRRKEPLSQANSNIVSKTPDSENSEFVVLKMDSKEPLGIHVVPDYDRNGNDRGLLVQRIDPGKKVSQDGRLAVNDRIVEINDRNLLNKSFNTVQDIFQKSLKSPELRLRVVKQHQQSSSTTPTRPLNGVSKKQPPPVYPKPSVNHPKHPMHNKENIAKVESEEKNFGPATKVATVSPTKKLQSTPHTGGNILMAVNTRKIGRLIELELTKGADGLGFTLTSRDNPIGGHFPIYIKNILPKGAAVEDGRLKCGDRLLSVNGTDLTGKTQADAVTEFRRVQPGGKVKIVVSRQEDIQSKSEGCEIVQVPVGGPVCNVNTPSKPAQQKECDVVDSAPIPKFSSSRPSSQGVDQSSIFPWRQREILAFDVPVHDSEKAGLGISVKGKTSTVAVKKQGSNETSIDMGIFINSVLHGGAASRDGRLRKNDQLLNVNGVSLLGLSNSAAMETLRRAIVHTEGPKLGAITLTVARKIGNSSNHQKHARRNSSSSLLTDSSASTEQDHTAPTSTDNSGNSEHSDNTVIFLPSTKPQSKPIPEIVASRNPVLERLTGQLPTHNNGLRNESYYRATHQTSIMLLGKAEDRLTSPTINQSPSDMVIIEEDPPYSPTSETDEADQQQQPSASGQHRGSTTSTQATDVTYTSQLSLDEGAGFSRDAFGRQSMSEKRHATLDAKGTDTYKRNKKVREDREKHRILENRRSTIGVVKMNSTESIPRSDRNDAVVNQVGPALGMKKSSSLESLQTMVQEIQMAEDGVYRRGQVRASRGCNESFRAAVDRSYDVAPRAMEPVPEDDGCHFPPRQSSLNSQLDCKLMKQQQHQNKKKSSLLKGLGSMFRFGRHRKPTILEETPSSSGSGCQKSVDEEKERARKVAKDEQQRIQEQYKLLLQRQMDMQQQQQQPQPQPPQPSPQQQQLSLYQNQRMHNGAATQYIQANNININNNYVPITNCVDMKQMRPHNQYKYVDRRSLFPPETKEEYYNGALRQSVRRTEAEPMFSNAARSSEKYNPAPAESNRYSHYVNYDEIQQHLNRRQQQHYHSQRRDNREMSHRPLSNFYEYESIQGMMQNQGAAVSNRASFMDGNMNATAATTGRNEFFPSSLYGSTRVRSNYDQRSYSTYQNSNIPYPTQQQISPPQKQFFYPAAPLYSNVRPISKNPGPYVTQVTIRDNHHHYTSNSLGTKV